MGESNWRGKKQFTEWIRIVFFFRLIGEKRKALIREIELVSGREWRIDKVNVGLLMVGSDRFHCPIGQWTLPSAGPYQVRWRKIVDNLSDSICLRFPFDSTCTHEKWLFRFFFYVSHFSSQQHKPTPRRQIYVSINFLFVFHLLIHTFLSFSAPNNFKGLLLRSHVLYRLKHYQSSLADVDNALKSRPSSYKVSFRFSFRQ